MREKLLNKLYEEFQKYEKEVLSLSGREIFEKSYETTIKSEFVGAIETEDAQWIPDDLIDKLYRCDCALDFLYYEYMKCDSANVSEELCKCIDYIYTRMQINKE